MIVNLSYFWLFTGYHWEFSFRARGPPVFSRSLVTRGQPPRHSPGSRIPGPGTSSSSQDTDMRIRHTLFCSYQNLISEYFLIIHFSILWICSSERVSKTRPTPKFLLKSKAGFLRDRIFKSSGHPHPELWDRDWDWKQKNPGLATGTKEFFFGKRSRSRAGDYQFPKNESC